MILVCFAVPEEARPFRQEARSRSEVRVLVTGMGEANARKQFLVHLNQRRPSVVLTCGFAGGLRDDLKTGALVVDADPRLSSLFLAPKFCTGRFATSQQVLSTTDLKRAFFKQTGAAAVEMESQTIREQCRQAGIPSATLRVILDEATEDLPMDFQSVMTPSMQISVWKFAKKLASEPKLVPRLIQFSGRVKAAALTLSVGIAEACDAFLRSPNAQGNIFE